MYSIACRGLLLSLIIGLLLLLQNGGGLAAEPSMKGKAKEVGSMKKGVRPLIVETSGGGELGVDADGKFAAVTLVMGSETGYHLGALALGQSLIDIGNNWRRVALVTPEVPSDARKQLSTLWDVLEVPPVLCNHSHSLDPTQFDLKGERYQAGLKKWGPTCTKFQAWRLTQFSRVAFMDSDLLIVGDIDDILFGYSNASFVAAPEAFPPDTFNSGLMVLQPSLETFARLLELNVAVGSAEGGDQGVLNNGLCPNWFTVNAADPDCGRMPWIFNVPAAHFEKYRTLRLMSRLRPPAVIHFVSDAKPWTVLMFEYYSRDQLPINERTAEDIKGQASTHVQWRQAYFRAIRDPNPRMQLLADIVEGTFKTSNGKKQVADPGQGHGERDKNNKQSKSRALEKESLSNPNISTICNNTCVCPTGPTASINKAPLRIVRRVTKVCQDE